MFSKDFITNSLIDYVNYFSYRAKGCSFYNNQLNDILIILF